MKDWLAVLTMRSVLPEKIIGAFGNNEKESKMPKRPREKTGRGRFLMDGEGNTHKPKRIRAHVAQEMVERGLPDIARELSSKLAPWARKNLGVK